MRSLYPVWWDREIDKEGQPIRADVRQAAQEIWPKACRLARSMAGDDAEASEVMEVCVTAVTRHLEERQHALFSQSTNGLLLVAFRHELLSRITRNRRVKTIEDLDSLQSVSTADWASEIELRVDMEKLRRSLSPRSRKILALRDEGYEWNEIASMLGIAASTAKNSFCRELRTARSRIRNRRTRETDKGKF